mmetsp:Transcript_11891/g.36151  ORF Transcript_11891/g.36151 Transcript_11891/m.36151 type:complete len:334 (-) Transcript_11891:397-1398(-)
MGGNGHHCPCAVRPENIVRNPDRDSAAADRVDRVGACEDPALGLLQLSPLQVRLLAGLLHVGLHLFLLSARGDLGDKRVLGREAAVGGAEESVRPGGEDLQGRAMAAVTTAQCVALHPELDRRALGLADPVPLHLLDGVGPVQIFQIFQQPLRIVRDSQHPLLHWDADHGMGAALAQAVNHLLVGKDCAEGRAPVHRDLGLVRESLLEELEEDPLGPLVVIRICCADLPRPVEGEAERLELLPKPAHIRCGRVPRVGPRVYRVLLRGKSKGIPTHGMHHLLSKHSLVTRRDVSCGVPLWVSYVEPRPARVGEHVQNVKFFFAAHMSVFRNSES